MIRTSACAVVLLLAGCRSSEVALTRGDVRAAPSVAPVSPAQTSLAPLQGSPQASGPRVAAKMTPAVYPWGPSASSAALDARFSAPPAGFARVALEEGSFGAFLRTLPLLPEGAPVLDFRGTPLHDQGRHDNIAAVADIDVGKQDLQQCADAVFRMHAEWRYGRGDRDLSYRTASGTSLSYKRFTAGERAVIENGKLVLRNVAAKSTDEHKVFRSYLDEVFAWANTASLERDGGRLAFSDLRAGDAFVMSGNPFGHAVLVLDVARDEHGRLALLLGQSFMPAQSFHVLRPSKDTAWFILEPNAAAIVTPFWAPFPISALRRLP